MSLIKKELMAIKRKYVFFLSLHCKLPTDGLGSKKFRVMKKRFQKCAAVFLRTPAGAAE